MSNVIDNRIVEMRFDNKQFESAVSTSMGTLSKLKESLNFEKNGSNFLQNIGNSLSKIDLSGLTGVVESAGSKFSALEAVAVGALMRIGQQAVDAGERLVKSLSIDQITAGWEKYGEMTRNVATIMSATGDSIDVVSGQMEKLLYFTDETSYNFTDMANNIGKFTANGIDLDKATSAMEGIATWAAKSGQNAGTASRVMYNLAQAIGMGALKLQDWKSVELANMGTKEFKEMAIQAGIASGTLKQVGDKIVTVGKNTAVSVSNFRETLAEGWLDTNTLMGTLNEYGKAAELISDIHDSTGLWAADMMDLVDKQRAGKLTTDDLVAALELEEDEVEDNKEVIDELAASIEKLASDEYKFSLEAYKAGQEARTLGDAIDAVKDAVSSGWMTSFQWLFGEYDKAKGLWTDVAEALLDIFNAGSDARNELLKDWGTSNWEKLSERIEKAGGSVEDFEKSVGEGLKGQKIDVDELIDEYGSLASAIEHGAVDAKALSKSVSSAIGDIISGNKGGSLQSAEDKLKEVQAVINKVWSGELGNGADRVKALQEMGYEADAIQKLVEKGADYQLKLEDITDMELANLGLTDKQIKELRKIQDDYDTLGDLAGKSGRELFAEAILSGLTAIAEHLELVRKTWNNVFGKLSGDRLKELTIQFRDFADSLKIYDEESGELTKRGANLAGVLERVFEAVKQVGTFFRNIGRIIGQFASEMAPAADAARDLLDALLDLFNSGMTKLNNFLGRLDFTEQFASLSEVVTHAIEWMTEKVDDLREKFEQTNFSEWFDNIGQKAQSVRTKLSSFFKTTDDGSKKALSFESVLQTIGNALQSIKTFFQPAIDALQKFWTNLKGNFDFSNVKNAADAVQAFTSGLVGVFGGAWKGLKEGVDRLDLSFGGLLKTFLGFKIGNKVLASVLGEKNGLTSTVTELGKSIKNLIDDVGEKGIIKTLLGSGGESSGPKIKDIATSLLMLGGALLMIAAALAIVTALDPDKLAASFGVLVGTLASVGGLLIGFGKLAKSLKVSSVSMIAAAAAILIVSVALIALAGALALFSLVVDMDNTTTALIAMFSTLALVVGSLMALSTAGPVCVAAAAAILVVSVALIALAGALALFSLVVDMDNTTTALIAMFVTLGLVVGGLMALSTVGPVCIAAAAAILVVSVALIALAGALALFTVVVNMDGTTKALIAMAVALGIVVAALIGLSMVGPMVLVAAVALALAAAAALALSVALAAAGVAIGVLGAGLTVLIAGVGIAAGVAIAAIGLGIGSALKAVGEGIGGIFAGIGEGIGAGITAIGAGIATANGLIGVSVESLGTSIGNGFQNVAAGIDAASAIISAAFDRLGEGVGTTIEKFGSKVGSAIEGVGESIAKAGDSISGVGDSIASVGDGISHFGESVKSLSGIDLIGTGKGLIEFAKGVKNLSKTELKADPSNIVAYAQAIANLSSLVGIVNQIATALEIRMRQMGQIMGGNLASALQAQVGPVSSAGNLLGAAAFNGASSYTGSFYSIGANMAQGLANGIRSNSGAASTAAGEMANKAAEAARKAADEHSPSKVFARIGEYMSLGLAKGINDESSSVANASEAMTNNAIQIAAYAARAISDAFAAEDDELTITPILDLTNVEKGSSRLSSILSGTRTAIGLTGQIQETIAANQNSSPIPQLVTLDPTSAAMFGSGSGDTVVRVNFEGSLAQLAAVLQPAIMVETNRLGTNLVNE